MDGTSKQAQSSSSTSQLTPYAPAATGLQSLLAGINPSIANLNGGADVQNALDQLKTNASAPNPFAAPSTAAGLNLLNGGPDIGTANGILTNAYGNTTSALSPYTSGNALDPSSNPALAQELSTIGSTVRDTVNPVFSAAGRLASPDNAKAIASGITTAATPLLQNAATNQLNAINLAQGAAGTTASGLAGNDVANAGILGSGLTNASTAYGNQNLGPLSLLAAALQGNQIPIQNASSIAGILGPLAAQFGQTNSTGTSTGTNTMSGAQQFATLAQGFNSLMNPFKTNSGLSLPSFPS